MLRSCEFEKYLVAINADDSSAWSNSLCNARGNSASTTADIKHKKRWPQYCGQAAMISLKCPPPQSARIGPM